MLGLVSLHFQCDILAPITVLLCKGQLLIAGLRLTGGPQVADLLVAEVVDGHAAVLLCAMQLLAAGLCVTASASVSVVVPIRGGSIPQNKES